MLLAISLVVRIFMNDSSKHPLATIIALIFLGYMISYIICYLCSRVYRFIVKIVCDFSKWIEHNENSASKSRLISAVSMALLIIISLSKLLNDIIKIINKDNSFIDYLKNYEKYKKCVVAITKNQLVFLPAISDFYNRLIV